VPTGASSFPWRVRLNPSGTELWVSLRDSDEVLIINTQTNAVITTISGFDRPADIVFCGEQLPVAEIPTLSEWGMIIIAGFLGLISLYAIRRKLVTH